MTPVDSTCLLDIQDLGLTPVLTRDRTAPAVVKYNRINSHTHTMSAALRCRTTGEANKFLSPSILAVRCSKSYSALQRNGSPAFSVKPSRLYFPVQRQRAQESARWLSAARAPLSGYHIRFSSNAHHPAILHIISLLSSVQHSGKGCQLSNFFR